MKSLPFCLFLLLGVWAAMVMVSSVYTMDYSGQGLNR